MMISRRRFIAISAALAAMPAHALARTEVSQLWTGQALGARASIRLAHPDGERIAAWVMAEIDRLENILSLYRADSALCRLNRDGRLDEPPFELLECLSLAAAVHRASGGRFDPSVQPLWALWATSATAGKKPDAKALAATLERVGWQGVAYDAATIAMRPGMALTLNGIGQGYVADRVAALLEAEGLTDILVDTGELRAIGGQPASDGMPDSGWPVRLETGSRVALRQRSLATSAPLGTTFDQAGTEGHILDPATGLPAPATWRAVSISAPSAAIADAVATAACLMPDAASVQALVTAFPGARIEAIS